MSTYDESEPHITRPNTSEDDDDGELSEGCSGVITGLIFGSMLGLLISLVAAIASGWAGFYWEDMDNDIITRRGKLYRLVQVDKEYKPIKEIKP